MRLRIGGSTNDIDPKSIEMNSLTLNHPKHNPAEGFEVTGIWLQLLTLTQKVIERIIRVGKLKSCSLKSLPCMNFTTRLHIGYVFDNAFLGL